MHLSVLFKEALHALNIKPDGVYVDATFGRGGHSAGILANLNEHGRLIAFDQDQSAIEAALNDKRFQDNRFQLHHMRFTDLFTVIESQDLVEKIDGVLLDLGVSSPQLDDASRGFSFLKDGPLDMRMDPSKGRSAAEYLQTVKDSDLAEVIRLYGEERYARRVAAAICHAREIQSITTTLQLAEIVSKAVPKWEKHKHPATRTFQALRIYVNEELIQLEQVMPQALEVLKPYGRLVVIAFHSLEDRLVKEFIRKQTKGEIPAKVPITEAMLPNRLRQIDKTIRPSSAEIADNPRARSAMMRIIEKLK